jgi:TolB protein
VLEFLDLAPAGWMIFDSTRGGSSELWAMEMDGRQLRRVTAPPFDKWHPSLSPNGQLVAFHQLREGNRDICTVPTGGGVLKCLTDHPAKDWLPRWSPDGELILFGSDRTGNQDVFLVPAPGGEVRQITNDPANDHNPIWSPDGRYVAFGSNRHGPDEIYVVGRNGGVARRLTRQSWIDVVPLDWSAARDEMYVWARGGGHAVGYWTVNAATGTAHLMLAGSLTSRQLGVSLRSDGRRLYFPVWERLADLWLAELGLDRR